MKAEDIPYGYAYCYATDEQCARAAHCLRRHAARLNEERTRPDITHPCVTPAHVERVAAGTACGLYRPDTPLRYARGMTRLFDAVPRGIYPYVRKQVINVFGSERVFYYARNGERLIPPRQQEWINAIFKKEGLPTPPFDTYEMRPEWET